MRSNFFVKFVIVSIFLTVGAFAYAQGPGDAIAVRVIPNPQKLSPLMWYQQNVPNPGSPQGMKVDGYPAIRDGRSVYVAGTNYDEASAQLYSNIYLISHSASASTKVQAVFDEFINQFRLNVNIADEEDKLQIRRDMHRANDLNVIRAAVERYMAKTGSYPEFEAGSYLPSSSYSTWPSWQTTLGNLLGVAMPVDPRNEFIGCDDPYDAQTCWDQTGLQFACPPEAYVYGYRSADNGSSYSVFTNYEYVGPGNWRDQNFSQQSSDQCFNFMGGDISDVDADGIPAGIDNCPEVFNAPDQTDNDEDGIGNACDLCNNDSENDKDNDGVCGDIDNCSSIANPDQSDLDGNGIGDVCDYQTCGNNIAEGSEKCDGQSGLEDYQQCSENCDLITQLSYCGDGVVDTPNAEGLTEECDGNDETQLCDGSVDDYKIQRERTCRDVCRYSAYTACLPIESCGDGTINGIEECDTGDQVGIQCVIPYDQTCEYCDSACEFEIAEGPHCDDGVIQNENGEQCDDGVNNGRVCTPPYGKTCNYCGNTCQIETADAPYCGDGVRDDPLETCDTTDVQTTACSADRTYFYKDRYCVLQSTAEYTACTWGAYEDCTARGSCGDGVLNGPEVCDDALSPAGLCSQCELADNSAIVDYFVESAETHTVCLGQKSAWCGVNCQDNGNGTADQRLLTCDAWGTAFTWDHDGTRNVNGIKYELPQSMSIYTVSRYEKNCRTGNPKIWSLQYEGSETTQFRYNFKRGRHCERRDRGITTYNFNGAFADELWFRQPYRGGFAEGTIKLQAKRDTITTSDEIVIMEQLKDSKWLNGSPLPSGAYNLTFDTNNGVLVWFGSSPVTPSREGVTTAYNRNAYILACVDFDENGECDFTQEI